MKLVKSLLLGSAAGVVVASGAMAADLPARKAAPAEYVRVCSAYGAGFFYIPGTDTCMKIGGLVRYQYEYYQHWRRSESATGTRGQLNLDIDVRNATAYGTLRAFARLSVLRRTGGAQSGSQNRLGQSIYNNSGFVGSTPDTNGVGGNAQTNVILDKAFIQFGGLTAGRAASFFDFYADAVQFNGGFNSSVGSTNLLAYTAVFGGGFSATVSLEDPVERRNGVTDSAPVALPVIGAGVSPTLNDQIRYGGLRAPDVVGALRIDQSWGSAQISGALHEVNVAGFSGVGAPANGSALAGYTAYSGTGSSKWGWGVQGGLKINLPMLAPGDALWLQAAYAQGATSYAGLSNVLGLAIASNSFGAAAGIPQADAYITAARNIVLTKSWSVSAAFLHYWTPTVRQAVFGSYASFDVPAAVQQVPGTIGATRYDWTGWRVGTNVYWSPVPNFDIGAEYAYTQFNVKGGVTTNSQNIAPPQAVAGSPATQLRRASQHTVMFRVQRGF